jgi:tRNA(Ile)-lysidine synthase
LKASLLTIARRALEAGGEAALPRGTTVLVAVSGGPDSMALLDVMVRLAPKLGLTIFAHGVDHGLRPAARKELDKAERFARKLGVELERTMVVVGRGGNLQARARVARWKALTGAARSHGAHTIATAHHADDRAETMLMRLLQGTGPRGLAAMPPRARAPMVEETDTLEVVRPLLRARRADVIAHVRRHAIPFAQDPSNADPRFLRARVRTELLPLLEELGPGIVHHLEALADDLGRDGEAPASWMLALPRRTRQAVEDLARSRSTKARVWLPGGLVVSIGESRIDERDTRKGPRAPAAERKRARDGLR